jgi:hypothetical protein
MSKKRGTILVENVIFLVLNLVFLTIMILFIVKQGAGASILEQGYAKQISLIIDSSNPGAIIKINMADAKSVAEEKNVPFEEVVSIEGNFVTVKLSEKGGYMYSFFNDADVNQYSSGEFYVITIDKKITGGSNVS